jgi:hypothetical protein
VKRAWIIPLVFLAVILSVSAYIPSRYFTDGVLTYWTKTDTSMVVNFDSLAYRNSQLQRLLDSIGGTDQKDIEFWLYTGKNFSGGTAETAWFYNARNMFARPLTLNSTPDRFKLQTEWSSGADDHGPTAFSIPAIQTDSALVFALTRINTQPGGTYGLTIFTRPANAGMSASRVTTGGNNPLESIAIDNSNFPDSGNSTFMNLLLRTKFP